MDKGRFHFIKRFLMEMPTVLVGVLLALALSAWKEKTDRDEKAQLVVSYVTAEIQDNYNSIKFIDSLSRPSLKEFNRLIKSFENGKRNDIPSQLFTTTIKNVAWEMAKTSDVFSSIPPDIITNMARVYQEQKRTEAIYKSLDEFKIKKDPSMSILNKAKYQRNHLESLLSRYTDLKRRYEEYLNIGQE